MNLQFLMQHYWKRRRYFYSATALQAKAAEIKRFKSSKSYKLHRLVTTIKRTIGLKQR